MNDGTTPDLLATEEQQLAHLRAIVERSIREQELIVNNLLHPPRETLTRGQRLSDRIARFGGSWGFIGSFMLVLVIWIVYNVNVAANRAFDPYPFILMNLVLSCIAAIQAPVIMMSQNRQEAKDRLRARNDYQVNLKAELEIRQLHEKIDHLLSHQWERMIEIQEVQLDLLNELRRPR